MKKSTLWAIVVVDTVLAAGIAIVAFFLTASYQAYSQPAVVTIEPGTSSREIGTQLEQQGVVRSRWLFLAARALRYRSKLMAGEYSLLRAADVGLGGV
jgi:cell division protein YceG involved in septum cleavage